MIEDKFSRNERNNKIINSTMSGHAPVILLCPSEPSYLDFLPDLFNNYKTVYTYDARWETQTDFVLHLAKKILGDCEYKKACSFCRCGIVNAKEIVLQKILSSVSRISNDCILFMCGLENLQTDFDFHILELLMNNCPDNLKLVFCATKILHLSYKIEDHNFPRIIICDKRGEELPFSDELFSNGLLSTQQIDILYHLSFYKNVELAFAESIYPGSKDLLNALSKTFRSLVVKIGGEYCFHPDFNRHIGFYVEKKYDIKVLHREMLDFYLKSKDYISALEKSYLYREKDYFEKAIINLLSTGKEDYVFLFFKTNDIDFSNIPICDVINKIAQKDYLGAMECYKKMPNDKIKTLLSFALNLSCGKREETVARICKEMSRSSEDILFYIRIVAMLTYSEERVLGMDKRFNQIANDNLKKGSDDIAFMHYLSKIQAATGNYSTAKDYLTRIGEICDYYSYSPSQLWVFFFNMPMDKVAVFAQSTSDKLLECCGYLCRGQKGQAISCLKGFTVCDKYSTNGMLSLALQSIFYAEAGNAEFGRSLALLYAVSAEREKRGETALFYIALAYCEYLLRNATNALIVLRNCKQGHIDSFFLFLAKAIELNCVLESERLSVLDSKVGDLFKTAEEKSYKNAIIVLRSCFLPLLSYAEKRCIQQEYVSSIYNELINKKEVSGSGKNVQIRFFGCASINIDKREIAWKTKKSKELFLLYCLSPEGVERSTIIKEIWSDYVYASAVNNLKTTNNLIRKTLKDYSIPFVFSYTNGKYKLEIDYSECDYSAYKILTKEYIQSNDNRKRVNLLNKILFYSDEGFAVDCDIGCFKSIDKEIKEEVSLYLSDTIKYLIDENDYLNAKRFMLKLEKLGVQDCANLKNEIEKMVYKK